MFDVASSTAAVGQVAADIGTLITYAVGIVLTGWAALIGLGFAVRHFKKYVSGRKF